MAVIKVETPNGVQEVEIAGNEPTPQEIKAMQKQFMSGGSGSTATVKDKTNALGNFTSGMKKGYAFGNDPLGTIGKAVGDKLDDLGSSKGKDKKSSGDDEKMTKQGVNFMKSELGLKNPNMAVTALQKMVNGDPISNPKEREAVAPIINAVVKSLQDQNGRTRLKTLFKSIK